MGICTSCCGSKEEQASIIQPSVEDRRRLQEEAAERRRLENESRGIKDVGKVRKQQERLEEIEKREKELDRMGGGQPALRWQAN